MTDVAFLRRTLIVAGVIVGLILAWRLREVELLLFGSILTAVFLRRVTRPLARRTPLPQGLALALATLGVVLLLVLIGAFFGWRIQAQVAEATKLLPEGFHVFLAGVRQNPFGARLLAELNQLRLSSAMPALSRLPFYALSATAAVTAFIAMVVGGIYLAAQPDLYRSGLLQFLPAGPRAWADGALDETAAALRRWLLAQLVAMTSVGLLVGVGMWIVGVEVPAALGLFAGLAEFVPVAGPIISAVPALLLALLGGLDKAAWTLLLFVGVQQFENHILLPLVQRRFAALPPVVTLFAIISFTVVFGPLGMLLGVPLTVVLTVLVKRLRAPSEP